MNEFTSMGQKRRFEALKSELKANEEFNLQPPVGQAEECHDEDSLGELETNEFDSIEIDIEDSRDMYDEISDNDLYDLDEEYSDGQPSEYDEWQDVYGGDDWDHGQYDYEWDCDLHNEF
jgi:hypothetical protein|tara:strand:- start:111 stop:467 length:357 start_codon:yes stop_codon:yes gene_type:complete